jgi:hypothetical protein
MALTTYADVRASVALWLNRNDLADVIPDFIQLCESDLNRRLRVPQNEAMETAYAVTGRYTALPSDFAEMRRLFLNYGAERLELVPAPQAGRVADGGVPFAYNIVNNKLEIVPESTAYTLELLRAASCPSGVCRVHSDGPVISMPQSLASGHIAPFVAVARLGRNTLSSGAPRWQKPCVTGRASEGLWFRCHETM